MPALRADAIVVLGCRIGPDGRPSEQLRRRVALGVELYREGAAPRLLFSGGGRGTVAEAEVMRELAQRAGVPDEAILCEDRSRDTAENALYSAALLQERGLCRIVLVSGRAHLMRARILFRFAGLALVGSAAVPPRSPARGVLLAAYNLVALPRSVTHVLVRRA